MWCRIGYMVSNLPLENEKEYLKVLGTFWTSWKLCVWQRVNQKGSLLFVDNAVCSLFCFQNQWKTFFACVYFQNWGKWGISLFYLFLLIPVFFFWVCLFIYEKWKCYIKEANPQRLRVLWHSIYVGFLVFFSLENDTKINVLVTRWQWEW